MNANQLPEQFQANIFIDESGCWLWQRSLQFGYGTAHLNGKRSRAHRFVYELLVGPIPEGMCIDHLCRVRHCVNPAHLEVVTNKENVLRGIGYTAQQARQAVCKRGHQLTGDNMRLSKKGFRVCMTCKRLRSNAWGKRQTAIRALGTREQKEQQD